MKTLHILIHNGDINGKLAALNGKLVVHLPNYTKLYEQAPVNTDSAFQVFKVLVPEDQMDIINEGQGPHPHIWAGTKGQRHSAGDLVSVEIVPEHALIDGGGSPTSLAAMAFAEYPGELQVAAVMFGAPDVAAKLANKSPDDINKWAKETLDEHVGK